MSRVDLNLVRIFVAALEEGSFTAAGQRLSLPRSTISRSVAALEEALGVELFRRTTRSVVTTEAGAALYKRVSGSVAFLEGSLADASGRDERPRGLVRVATTPDLAVVLLPSAIARCTQRYPEVQIEVQAGGEMPGATPGDVDLALRVSHAPLSGASVEAQRVGHVRLQLFASAAYLARRGSPRAPTDLAAHDWIALGNDPPPLPSASIEVRTRVRCGDSFMVRELLRNGAGIGALPAYLAEPDVDAGHLVRVLPQWFDLTGALYLVSPAGAALSREVEVVRDAILEEGRRGPAGSAGFRL